MALTTQQKAELLAAYQGSPELQALVQAAGIGDVIDGMRELYASQRRQAAAAALAGNVNITVADWAAVDSFLATGIAGPAAIEIGKAVKAKIAAHDTAGLGPLLIAMYAAALTHWNL